MFILGLPPSYAIRGAPPRNQKGKGPQTNQGQPQNQTTENRGGGGQPTRRKAQEHVQHGGHWRSARLAVERTCSAGTLSREKCAGMRAAVSAAFARRWPFFLQRATCRAYAASLCVLPATPAAGVDTKMCSGYVRCAKVETNVVWTAGCIPMTPIFESSTNTLPISLRPAQPPARAAPPRPGGVRRGPGRGSTFRRTYSAASWGSWERKACTAASPAAPAPTRSAAACAPSAVLRRRSVMEGWLKSRFRAHTQRQAGPTAWQRTLHKSFDCAHERDANLRQQMQLAATRARCRGHRPQHAPPRSWRHCGLKLLSGELGGRSPLCQVGAQCPLQGRGLCGRWLGGCQHKAQNAARAAGPPAAQARRVAGRAVTARRQRPGVGFGPLLPGQVQQALWGPSGAGPCLKHRLARVFEKQKRTLDAYGHFGPHLCSAARDFLTMGQQVAAKSTFAPRAKSAEQRATRTATRADGRLTCVAVMITPSEHDYPAAGAPTWRERCLRGFDCSSRRCQASARARGCRTQRAQAKAQSSSNNQADWRSGKPRRRAAKLVHGSWARCRN